MMQLKFILCFIIPLFFLNKIKAQSSDTLQIIIGDKSNLSSNEILVKQKISSMPNVRYMGYCSNHSLYLIKVPVKSYSTKVEFYDALIILTGSTDLLLKVGDFSDIIGSCIFDRVEDNEQIKKELGK